MHRVFLVGRCVVETLRQNLPRVNVPSDVNWQQDFFGRSVCVSVMHSCHKEITNSYGVPAAANFHIHQVKTRQKLL